VCAARQSELPLLPAIELLCEAMFAEHGIRFPPGPTVVEELISHNAEILVIGDPPVGFAGLVRLDGWLHLEQISTNAAQGRRGIGTRLLRAVLARGEPVTLITFRDIPWNAPWYARHGFTEPPACPPTVS
jgi:ribosomal protein S18 acetylase RimI-like enzyme